MPAVGALQPAADRILGEHDIDGKMLAHVAKEIEIAELAHPVVVVHQEGRVRAAIEVEEPPQLRFHAGDVRPQRLDREQIALLALAAGVADHARGPADQGDRPVAGLLEPPQHHQGHEVADVQAVGRRVEANVDGARLLAQQPRQVRVVGGLVDQSAPGSLSRL